MSIFISGNRNSYNGTSIVGNMVINGNDGVWINGVRQDESGNSGFTQASGPITEKSIKFSSNKPIRISTSSSIKTVVHRGETCYAVFSTQESEITKFELNFEGETLSVRQIANQASGNFKLDVYLTPAMLKAVKLSSSCSITMQEPSLVSKSLEVDFSSSCSGNFKLGDMDSITADISSSSRLTINANNVSKISLDGSSSTNLNVVANAIRVLEIEGASTSKVTVISQAIGQISTLEIGSSANCDITSVKIQGNIKEAEVNSSGKLNLTNFDIGTVDIGSCATANLTNCKIDELEVGSCGKVNLYQSTANSVSKESMASVNRY
jgi:Putative auto-transporter adhesin, head GIN domain